MPSSRICRSSRTSTSRPTPARRGRDACRRTRSASGRWPARWPARARSSRTRRGSGRAATAVVDRALIRRPGATISIRAGVRAGAARSRLVDAAVEFRRRQPIRDVLRRIRIAAAAHDEADRVGARGAAPRSRRRPRRGATRIGVQLRPRARRPRTRCASRASGRPTTGVTKMSYSFARNSPDVRARSNLAPGRLVEARRVVERVVTPRTPERTGGRRQTSSARAVLATNGAGWTSLGEINRRTSLRRHR